MKAFKTITIAACAVFPLLAYVFLSWPDEARVLDIPAGRMVRMPCGYKGICLGSNGPVGWVVRSTFGSNERYNIYMWLRISDAEDEDLRLSLYREWTNKTK